VEAHNNNNESRAGALFGLVAGVLVLALTMMAFNAFEPSQQHAFNWEVSAPEPSAIIVPSFES
jgi:uncharacterized membrane protein required for colicin V production